ncbi:hypothetical protein SOVF_146520 [Spinacia oleracea]|nr:hypothetical protein SOVF_146520 [Spinacia oleracea]
MKMVQRKVASNKLGNQAGSLVTEKMKPSLQNHDGKSKGADLKSVKMKKSRSVKRTNVEIGLHSRPEVREAPLQTGKPAPIVTPTNTPSPKKPLPLPCKSPYTSPNYMKSTNSSEARKEKVTTKVSNTISTSKLHRVANSVTKLSSFQKMRALIKTPSFKHTRSGACKKVVLCKSDSDVERATCSSTLKDSKFPTYLKLKPGATESEGNSVFKVCPYTYCSLNGHHHIAAPPLKRFLSSRRRLLKTLKVKPEVVSPRKAKAFENNENRGGDQKEDFFVQVFVPVPDRGIATQVSVSLSDGPSSEMDFQDQTEDTDLSGMNFSLKDEDYPPTPLQKQTSFESQSSPSEFFCENSDMEWEEGQSPTTHGNYGIYAKTDYSEDQDEPDFELSNIASEYLEFLADTYPPYFHDEMVECLSFSDIDSFSDSQSTQTGDNKHTEEQAMVTADMNSESKKEITKDSHLAKKVTVLAEESMNEQGRFFSDLLEEITEAQNVELDSYHFIVETEDDESSEGNYTVVEIGEESSEETSTPLSTITDEDSSSTKEEICIAGKDDQTDVSPTDDNCISKRSANSGEVEDSNKVELSTVEKNVGEVKASGMEDYHKTAEADALPAIRNSMQEAIKRNSNNAACDPNLKLLDSSSNLKRLLRGRKANEDNEEDRELNLRGPNFLTVEPGPEAEKVDLRHQEMDERRNAEDWMLDHALQKTVNQLAPVRKRKVALLVEAFESILPIPKFESNMRRKSSSFSHARPIQACS